MNQDPMSTGSRVLSWFLLALAAGLSGCDTGEDATLTAAAAPSERPLAESAPVPATAASIAFRDAVGTPPADWTGPVFALSHDYPRDRPPPCDPRETCPWLDIDVDFDDPEPDWNSSPLWAEYLRAILDYVRFGQDPNLRNERGFRTRVGGETRWYHVPWMAFDPTLGREFVHGTTNERSTHLSELVKSSIDQRCADEFVHGVESWAVGMYNAFGGWTLGQAFAEDGRPGSVESDDGAWSLPGLPFPEGTVVAKILTINASVECVDYLVDAPVWTVNRHRYDAQAGYQCGRIPQTTRPVQLDVAVVDERSPTRWVYGTFIYNGHLQNDSFWARLVPVGLQWGSDPLTFPAVDRERSKPASQSVLNDFVASFASHYGCEGRLAGPVDNPASSCVSCHGAAYAAPGSVPFQLGSNVPPAFGFDGMCVTANDDNADYFANRRFPDRYPGFPQAASLDTSLQLWVALNNVGYYESTGAPLPCCEQPGQRNCTPPNQQPAL